MWTRWRCLIFNIGHLHLVQMPERRGQFVVVTWLTQLRMHDTVLNCLLNFGQIENVIATKLNLRYRNETRGTAIRGWYRHANRLFLAYQIRSLKWTTQIENLSSNKFTIILLPYLCPALHLLVLLIWKIPASSRWSLKWHCAPLADWLVFWV